MAAITIDEKARFVSVLSFELGSIEAAAVLPELQRTAEEQVPRKPGFVGCVVMQSVDKTAISVVSVWESADAWSAAEYDQHIGRVVTDIVETAKSYRIQTYETITVVRPA